MEILKTFGFEPILFIAQVVNFLLIAAVLAKFLYKPLLKLLKDREKKIAKGLKDAEAASMALQNAEEEHSRIVSVAGKEAEKILEETKKTAEEMREKMLADSRTQADKIIKEAKNQADIQMSTMEKQAKSAALEVSVQLLEKVIGQMFSKEEKNDIMTRSIKQMKEVKE